MCCHATCTELMSPGEFCFSSVPDRRLIRVTALFGSCWGLSTMPMSVRDTSFRLRSQFHSSALPSRLENPDGSWPSYLLWGIKSTLQARVWSTGSARSAVFTDYNCQRSRPGKRIRHRSCFYSPNRLSSGQNSSSCLLRWNLLASVSTKLMLRLLQTKCNGKVSQIRLRAFPMVDAVLGIKLKITSINTHKGLKCRYTGELSVSMPSLQLTVP